MDWFLYDNGLRHERVSDTCSSEQVEMSLDWAHCNGSPSGEFPS